MSDVKFSCPYCNQHIVCDAAYCRNPISCPACDKLVYVPPVYAFTQGAPGKLELTLPVGGKSGAQASHQASLEPWTEEAWEKHAGKVSGEAPANLGIVWGLLIAPFPIALWLALHYSPRVILPCFLICAALGGFLWANAQGKAGFQLLIAVIGSTIGMLLGYTAIAGLLVFAGCFLL